MLNNILNFSIRNKLLIGLFTLGLIAWGSWSISQLPIDAVPDITNNQVLVTTLSPSLAAQEMERLVTFPLEMAVANIPKVIEVRSISRFGLSLVTIVFSDGTDIYWARQQVFERMQMAKAQIPPGVGEPELSPISTGLGEIYQYTLHAKKGYEKLFPIMDLRSLQDWIVRRQLLGTAGVADISSFGGYLKQYEVAVNADRLKAMGLSISDIFKALEDNNQNTGGAYIEKKLTSYFIRTEGLINSLSDIEKIVVKNTNTGAPVLIRDIATVQYGTAVRYGAMTYNDEGEVVGGIVLMLKGSNSSLVIKNVKKRIAEIQAILPKGVEIEPYLDRTKLVNNAIETVVRNLAEGALIVIFVLVLLLGNLRAGLLVASVIPLAMLFAISMMQVFGVSGNLMSLGAIDFGLIVDGAVIIVEATLHHLSLRENIGRITQAEMDDEVYHSASRMSTSAAFGEIIILIVYLPILALTGIEGKMFGPMAQTVSFAIMGAFILSLTYIPMMASLFLSKNIQHKKNFSDRIIDFFQWLYRPAINFALHHKKIVVAVAMVMLLAAFALFSTLGGEFIPTLEEGDFAVETRLLTGSSLQASIDMSNQAAKIIRANFPEVKEVVGKIGTSEIPTDPMPIEACDLIIVLKDKGEWTSAKSLNELAEKMHKALAVIPGVEFGFQQPIQMRFNELMTGVKQDVAIKIYGEDIDILASQAAKIGDLSRKIPGVTDLVVERVKGLPQIVVSFYRDRLAEYGLSIAEANRTVNAAFAGATAGIIYEGEKRYNLTIRLENQSRQNLEDVQGLYIHTPKGENVPLSQLADVSFKVGSNQIQRENTKRFITLAFNVRGRDVESIVNEIKAKIAKQIKLPVGYLLSFGGQFENLQAAKARLSIAVPVALLLILVLLFFTFGSIKQSLLIFTAIPLSAIGGILALWIRGMPFSISAGVGFIALFGVAVLNGIVLIAEFNRLRQSGEIDLNQIVLKGTSVRLRPVMMTALVASLGFLPMALSNGSGAEVQKPLATVVIGGLISATLLTLLVLPCLYIMFEHLKPVRFNKVAAAIVLLLMSGSAFGQSASLSSAPLSLEQVIEQAKQNNLSIQRGQYLIRQQQALQGAAHDWSNLDFVANLGQYNTINFDQQVTVTQRILNPKYGNTQLQLTREHIKGAETQLKFTANELVYAVKRAYYDYQFFLAKKQQLERLDSVLQNFVRAATLRTKTGEASSIEQILAESQLSENHFLQEQIKNDLQIAVYQLRTLLNTNELPALATTEYRKRNLVEKIETSRVAQNPLLIFYQQQIAITRQQLAVEKARRLPDFSIGYSNASLIGNQLIKGEERFFTAANRFHSAQLGVSFPIISKPFKARIAAAEMGIQAAQTQSNFQQRELEGQLSNAIENQRKSENAILYYEKTALPTANSVLQRAERAYRAGEIPYTEYLTALQYLSKARLGYLDAIAAYNKAVIAIEFLIGN
jgi:cobalt-zinc-cadmium resistance protein CzcA